MDETRTDIRSDRQYPYPTLGRTNATRAGMLRKRLIPAAMVVMGFPLALLTISSVQAAEVRTGADAFGGWEDDAPGLRRHIEPTDLPPPTNRNHPEQPDYERMPNVVDAPDGVTPKSARGFLGAGVRQRAEPAARHSYRPQR